MSFKVLTITCYLTIMKLVNKNLDTFEIKQYSSNICIKENIAWEIKKCFIPNNENTIYQNL